MSVAPSFHKPSPVPAPMDHAPVVLRFARLNPDCLSGFGMHDGRRGGDLSHIDLSRKSLNRVEHGPEDWATRLTARIARIAAGNLKREIAAQVAKGRGKAARALAARGPGKPWNGNTEAPLREGILTVDKRWFGGTGFENWDSERVEEFRQQSMAFLRAHFPKTQLIYAASHSDEEAFHFHFIVGAWELKTTVNRGRQLQLRAAVNPLLADYEHAQDLAGQHFAPLGLLRGERRAEARRQARAEGREVPKRRRHVSPSEYREAQREMGRQEAEALRAAAKEDCGAVVKKTRQRATAAERKMRRKHRKADARLKDQSQRTAALAEKEQDLKTGMGDLETAVAVARQELYDTLTEFADVREAANELADEIIKDAQRIGEKLVRKSRKRAAKEANIQKKNMDREVRVAELLKRQAAERAEAAELHKVKAETLAAEATAKAETAQAEASQAKNRTEASLQKAHDVIAIIRRANSQKAQIDEDVKQADARLARLTTETIKQQIACAEAKAAAASARKTEAEAHERIALSKAHLADLECAADMAQERGSKAESASAEMGARIDAITAGLDMLASGVLSADPQSGQLGWGAEAPEAQGARKGIVATLKAAGRVITTLATRISRTVQSLLQREREDIAKDASLLADIREEMGLRPDEGLEDVRRRYADRDDGPGW